MTKFLIGLVAVVGLVYLIAHDTWRITLDTTNYQISISFIMFLAGLALLWWIFMLIQKPVTWWTRFQTWRKSQKQEKKDAFLSDLLTAFLSHKSDMTDSLIKEAQKIYGSDSREALLTSALLSPEAKTFNELNKKETTKLVGLYGLVEEAEAKGDLEEVETLLQQVPKSQEKTLWVEQAKMKLALNRNDWKQALALLEQSKKQLDKTTYKSHKACLLLKLGHAKEAYHLAPNHLAIALAYAKVEPKKAKKILERLWRVAPGWQVYSAYKKAIQHLSEEKRLKAVLALTHSTRDQRYSLLARADMDTDLHNWARAKENLEIYLQNYPLTRQVADMMANLERTAWHHEDLAIEWEQKAVESEDDSLWRCNKCTHTAGEWQILCPHCNAFDSLYNR